ncbi:hypothetical protein buks_2 [Escherichia phage buks]|uniref:Uncharacterized protein n=20 Tax=Viruses TaxID=10239 RepID=I2G824_9CAUD|nr:hypothetical protein F491_gp30 [Salmonella phage vB_SenS-Ent1]YP_008058252.1 hypothetical protein M170_gp06 [Salmonella phage L13]YP_009009954.1 hypothetical protein CF94_gp30 [Salmonella phage vB_SenS-Ent2]YP_009035167.1 hypothetical protein FP71_gp30 [Salmonella phage vB_SenS-Ent3]YP_009280166.1 hypothetical protein BI170_gp38 [Salmonella phage MA12]YP_010745995.1 hypothetical protein QA022_gp44 [Salmonella phage blauehaus]YP_010746056.1 hypothetical protein QA023_gp38 [Salmonella phage 
MNINDYTGLPYDFRRRNCWHHVRNVRADAGLSTPMFDVTSPTAIDAAFDDGHSNPKGLVRAVTPQNFDAVLLGVKHRGRIVWHAGVYYEGMVSHCELASRQVRLDSLEDLKDTYSEIEFWR